MTVERTDLPSGLRVVTEHVPATRSAALGLWVGVGSRDETTEEAGCSHFLEHLLFKGTGKRSALEIAETLDAIGGEMNAFTSKELTCFYARVLDHDLPVAMDVLGDMLVDASNTAEDVEQERQVVLEEINIHFDSPDDLVHTDLSTVVLGSHPLALEVLGSVESITGMARDTIHGYYERTYQPHNVVVAAAGNVEHQQVLDLVAEHIGDLGRTGADQPRRTAPTEPFQAQTSLRHRPTEQAHVAFGGSGLAVGDERRHAFHVLNGLLGGGMSSRLFQEIREQRGLAYTTYSYASMHTDAGMWGAYAGTTPSRVDEVLKVLRDQLDRVADEVTQDEVDRAKGQIKGNTVLGLEDSGSRMNRIGKLTTLEQPILSVDELLARTNDVTLDQVREVARDVLGGPRSLAVVGPFEGDQRDRFATWVDA